ncbi:MAG: membrane protein insertase YidC, partial [Acidobacteriota bacterium]
MEKRLLLAAALSLGVLVLWEAVAAKNAPHPAATRAVPTAAPSSPGAVPGSQARVETAVSSAVAPAAALE